ncbi:phosphoethanolamine transferase [Xenophilus sp.]|uniref:phosphoethanolamine transferase n=1 Tax=Xenophilus sp. TaxID=1873499 RepID=UPI0037DD9284
MAFPFWPDRYARLVASGTPSSGGREPCFWVWLLCLLCVVMLCLPTALNGSRAHGGSFGWSDTAAMTVQFWLLWLALWGRMGVALLLALPFALIWPLEVWIRLHYGSSISANFVALAFETSPAELADLLSTLGWLVWLPLGWLALYGCAVWVAFHWRLRWRGRSRWIALGLLIGLTGLFSLANDAGQGDWSVERHSSDAPGLDLRPGPSTPWSDAYPVNLITAMQTYRLERTSMAAIRSKIEQHHFGAHVVDPARAAETVVLVIGESSTAQRWSLLGYERETNPRLKAFDLVAFGNVASVASLTRVAVPAALSPRPALTSKGEVDIDAQPSLVKAFAEAGYDTYWFSNQAAMGPHDSSIAIYAAEARHVRFMNPSSYSARGSLDEILLPALDEALAQAGPKLIVLHTLGSHFDQSLRYPSAFAHFQPVSGVREKGAATLMPASQEQLEDNAYDNSVLYTDHVLAEVIRRVESRGGRSVVAYFSDHGVDVHRTSCRPRSVMVRATRASRHVPVIFWLSQAFRERNPYVPLRLQEHRDLPYTTTVMFSSLLEISGVTLESVPLDALESLLRAPVKGTSSRRYPDAFADSCQRIAGSL